MPRGLAAPRGQSTAESTDMTSVLGSHLKAKPVTRENLRVQQRHFEHWTRWPIEPAQLRSSREANFIAFETCVALLSGSHESDHGRRGDDGS